MVLFSSLTVCAQGTDGGDSSNSYGEAEDESDDSYSYDQIRAQIKSMEFGKLQFYPSLWYWARQLAFNDHYTFWKFSFSGFSTKNMGLKLNTKKMNKDPKSAKLLSTFRTETQVPSILTTEEAKKERKKSDSQRDDEALKYVDRDVDLAYEAAKRGLNKTKGHIENMMNEGISVGTPLAIQTFADLSDEYAIICSQIQYIHNEHMPNSERIEEYTRINKELDEFLDKVTKQATMVKAQANALIIKQIMK